MNIEQFKKVVEFLHMDLGIKPQRYSGRGMFGRECVGITCTDPFEVICKLLGHFSNEAIEAERNSEEETDELVLYHYLLSHFEHIQSDTMGFDKIVYFPDWVWEDGYRKVVDEVTS